MSSPLVQKIVLIAMLFSGSMAFAQIPVEAFGGHKKTTLDIMFFKFFKNKAGENAPFLFFNRNRASIDYQMSATSYLPQFGFTEAISYNHEKMKGFAPVLLAQIFSTGVYPKAGIQYALIRKNMTLFSWIVSETKTKPKIDLFFLGRYSPKLSEKLNLFCQLELLNSAPTENISNFSFTQRIRLGLKIKAFQLGAGADFNQQGRLNFINTSNIGAFLRYEF